MEYFTQPKFPCMSFRCQFHLAVSRCLLLCKLGLFLIRHHHTKYDRRWLNILWPSSRATDMSVCQKVPWSIFIEFGLPCPLVKHHQNKWNHREISISCCLAAHAASFFVAFLSHLVSRWKYWSWRENSWTGCQELTGQLNLKPGRLRLLLKMAKEIVDSPIQHGDFSKFFVGLPDIGFAFTTVTVRFWLVLSHPFWKIWWQVTWDGEMPDCFWTNEIHVPNHQPNGGFLK